MGTLPVVVEDAQDLRRAAAGAERVRDHRGKLRGLAGLTRWSAPPAPARWSRTGP